MYRFFFNHKTGKWEIQIQSFLRWKTVMTAGEKDDHRGRPKAVALCFDKISDAEKHVKTLGLDSEYQKWSGKGMMNGMFMPHGVTAPGAAQPA